MARRGFLALATGAALAQVTPALAARVAPTPPLGKWGLASRRNEGAPGQSVTVQLIFRSAIDVDSPLLYYWRQSGSPGYGGQAPWKLWPPTAVSISDLVAGIQTPIDLSIALPVINFPPGVVKTAFRVNVEMRENLPPPPNRFRAAERRATFSFLLTVVNPSPTCPTGKLCVNPVGV